MAQRVNTRLTARFIEIYECSPERRWSCSIRGVPRQGYKERLKLVESAKEKHAND